MTVLKKIPSLDKILSVFGVIVLLTYTWMLLWFFWIFPSWLHFLSLGEILVVLSYPMSITLLDSLLVLIALLLLCIVLPKKWFYDCFVEVAVPLTVFGLAYLMYFSYLFQRIDDFPRALFEWSPLIVLFICVASFLVARVGIFRKWIGEFADQATIFVYLLLPLSLLSLVVVLVRNLF